MCVAPLSSVDTLDGIAGARKGSRNGAGRVRINDALDTSIGTDTDEEDACNNDDDVETDRD